MRRAASTVMACFHVWESSIRKNQDRQVSLRGGTPLQMRCSRRPQLNLQTLSLVARPSANKSGNFCSTYTSYPEYLCDSHLVNICTTCALNQRRSIIGIGKEKVLLSPDLVRSKTKSSSGRCTHTLLITGSVMGRNIQQYCLLPRPTILALTQCNRGK